MTKPRDQQVSLEATPYYHCYVRCVRKAYLCGYDREAGKDHSHRKQWLVSRLKFLSYVYAIDLCAYAILDNHYHVVLHVDKDRALSWSKQEVAERWLQLYAGHTLVNRWLASPGSVDKASLRVVDEIIEKWRERLYNLSWFMRGVNEKIARMVNEEENCKGRFWEGRFKSQALLDDAAILSCMTYVDLNPVRAGIESTLYESDFTSIQERLYDYSQQTSLTSQNAQEVAEVLEDRIEQRQTLIEELGLQEQPSASLFPFDGSGCTSTDIALPFTKEDYFALVEKTGQVIREGKRGFISADSPKIISRFGIDPDKWIDHIKGFGKRYGMCAGSVENVASYAERFGRQWSKGIRNSGRVYVGTAFS